MKENDLVEKLAIQICDISNGKEWDATLAEEHKERHRVVVQEEILPIIRSYANGLVAAAVGACVQIAEEVSRRNRESAKNLHSAEIEKMDRVESRNSYGLLDGGAEVAEGLAKMFRSVTPESAAKELERIKNAARLEEAKWWRYLVIMDEDSYFSIEGNKRIAALEAAKEK